MTRLSVIALTLGLVCGTASIGAQRPATGTPGQSGFRTLTGQAARAFQAPADMRLVAQERTGTGGQILTERYRQYVGDAEVLGGQVTIYRDDAGARDAVVGAHYPNLTPSNALRLTAGNAQGIAIARRNDAGARWTVELMLNPGSSRYFYHVESRSDDARWFYWIDADSGEILNEYDGLTTGTADDVGVLGDLKDLSALTTFQSGTYRMVSSDGRQTTYDAINRNRLPGTLATDTNDVWNTPGRTSPGQPAMVDAQVYARVTDGYYLNTHGFNWTSKYPQGMVSSVHLQRNYNNAYWNGAQMAYGDGDGSSFREFSGDLDVVGHELSHGVTEATSNLIYQNESGALNEAFSDIMGTAIEHSVGSANWTIGEDITIGSNGIRNMANPGEDGDPSYYADRYTGTADNGGVHTNSGIANHWFYLLVNGGVNADPDRASGTPVVGLGLASAQNIAFMGFTALPASATFCQARSSTIAVAGPAAATVADAWDEVGVTEVGCAGSTSSDGPVITNVASAKLKGGKFKITWTTDELSDSAVIFTCCGTFSNSTLATAHSMQFNGTIGASYEYHVRSTDGDGHSSTAGPFTHQN